MTELGSLGEFGFIDRLAHIFKPGEGVIEGIGDDCAVLRVGGATLLVTCDMSVEDVHFRRAYASPEDIGWKAVAVSLSDIAAMGGVPRFITVSLAAPAEVDAEYLERIAKGMEDAARFGGASIVGGDTTLSPGGIVIDTTVIGEATENRYILRKGARPGDLLLVTGELGWAALALHALEHGHTLPPGFAGRLHHPRPRVAEGQWLRDQGCVHAMIDVSDGLVQDAAHIAEASGVAVDIHPYRAGPDGQIYVYCMDHRLDPADFALGGGDDYELALAVSDDAAHGLIDRFKSKFGVQLVKMGRFIEGEPLVTVGGQPFERGGYDHFRR